MDERVKERSKKLQELGLIYNGDSFVYEDINFHWTDLQCMEDEEFEKSYQGALKRKKIIDKNNNCKNDLHNIQIKADGRCHHCESKTLKDRYEIQHFDYANGGRSWHVYDKVEHYHIHTASPSHLKEDKSVPDSCVKICEALNFKNNSCF